MAYDVDKKEVRIGAFNKCKKEKITCGQKLQLPRKILDFSMRF